MTLSKIIYAISKLLFYVCIAVVGFVLVSSILTYFEMKHGLDITFIEISEDGNQTKTTLPLTQVYVGFQNSVAIIIMWISFIFYSIYFFTVSQFFKVFTEAEIFTKISLAILKRFIRLNTIPLAAIIIYICFTLVKGHKFIMNSEYKLVVVHLIVGLLVYLYLELIKKGKLVQDENNLTI